jgi:hypothetical protein
MHHGNDVVFNVPSLRELEAEERAAHRPIGPTGRYPDGKLTPGDGGEIGFTVGAKDGSVVMEWGHSCAWVGFTPDQARVLARTLRIWAKRAENLRR